MTAPRVEVRRIRLHILITGPNAMRMEYEFVGREKEAAVGAFDAFGTR